MHPAQCGVEVGAGLLEIRVAEHLLHLVKWPTRFQRARFVSKIVEVQIDGSIGCFA
jgi:hypothetical protein